MSAMTESRQQVFVSGDGFSEPMSAQHNFANNFDLNDPDRAMSDYQRYVALLDHDSHHPLTSTRIMHEHTKRQLSTATDSARRRSGASSSNDSVSSSSS
jgi:hypothetical protein